MLIHAPFNNEQVDNMNLFQNDPLVHPFTCSNCRGVLTATKDGWICEFCHEHIKQDWAHEFMAEPRPQF
jgi:hypothetical protein